ncbi:uncharacterized protein [Nicotiana tomentosiformis]|uniref:uncharacterized protein n=1 Tax=Nicotiana tomentosiformis TaxID=4098 RepID=UPI00388CB150
MVGNNEDNVNLAAREATQLREKAARDAEEATLRDAQISYAEERSRRINQYQPLGADQFGNIGPGAGRPLGDYARPVYNQGLSSVRPPLVAANNIELKLRLLQTLQNSCIFRGKMNEDPNNHLMDFEDIINTFQYNGVSQDAVYLRAFPFIFKDDAKHWLRSLPNGSIRTWDEMTRKFLDKYFSSAKTAWERFKEILRKCKHSGIELWMQLQDFWDGLTPTSRRTLSNAAGGPLMKMTPEEIVIILDELSEDENQWPSEVAERIRTTGVHQVDANTSVQVQFDVMAKEIRKLTLASIHSEPTAACDICGRGHPTHECQASIEEVNAVGNYNFNAMGQKHPNLSWNSPGGTLLADTEKNPKETVNVVTLRNGQVLKDPTPIRKKAAPEKESGKELKIEDDDKKTKKKKRKKGAEKKKKKETSRREESNEVSKHMHALPFPQNLYREKLDKHFDRFLEMLRQVNVNFPFMKVLSQMPAYAKFLKEILTKKRKVEETSVVKLIEHCSAIF